MNFARFLFRRLLSTLPLFVFLPLLTFLLMHFVPGNYFDAIRMNPQVSPETVRQYEAMYHLDQPVFLQYLHWLKNLLRLDFGYSFAYHQPVLEVLGSRLGNTLLLSSVSFMIAWILAFFLGLICGVRPGGWLDRFLCSAAYAGLSIPNFFLCLLFLWLAAGTNWLPLGGMRSADYEALGTLSRLTDIARHMVIPVTVLAAGSFAYLFRLMRSQTLELAGRDFVLYLRSVGVPENRIIFRHIARNAVNPMITLLGMELPALFSGAALVEIFTGWPGLGSMMLQAVRTQDLFLVLGNIVMIALLLVAGNLLADILLAVCDPRIRAGEKHS